jgi:hypothetical protein
MMYLVMVMPHPIWSESQDTGNKADYTCSFIALKKGSMAAIVKYNKCSDQKSTCNQG